MGFDLQAGLRATAFLLARRRLFRAPRFVGDAANRAVEPRHRRVLRSAEGSTVTSPFP